jgi:hypothetical protein
VNEKIETLVVTLIIILSVLYLIKLDIFNSLVWILIGIYIKIK